MTAQTLRRAVAAELGLVAAIIVAFVLTAAIVVLVAPQFTWDEAVYALTPRHWLTGSPITGWGPHRPPVLSILGTIPVALGADQEAAFRVIGLAFGALLIVGGWVLGRMLGGALAGVLAAAAIAAAPTLAGDAGLFLNDVPATAVLLVVVALLWRAFERPDGPGAALLWVAPAAAAAFYIRYGSMIALLALLMAIGVVWPAKLARGWRMVVATIGLTAVLLVPHAVEATVLTGSPFGIALAAQSGASPAYPGEALVAYLGMVPGGLVGLVPGALIVTGVITCVGRLLSGRLPGRDPLSRALGLLVTTALIQIVVLGLFILPQARYVYFGAVLLVIAGCVGIVPLLDRRDGLGRAATVAVGGALLVSLVANPFVVWQAAVQSRAQYGWQREMGKRIAEETSGACSVLATDVPQITWYSGCEAYNFGNRGRDGDRDRLLTKPDRFLVLRADGLFQPVGPFMAGYLARVAPNPVAIVRKPDGSIGGTLYRFR